MDDVRTDGAVHAGVIESFIERGHAPSQTELSITLALDPSEIAVSLRRLAAGHGLVLHPGTVATWIAHPFSSTPTTVCVTHGDRLWWAPCMWCAAGIVSLVGDDALVHARWGGEHEPLILAAETTTPPLIHFALPPREAWTNVVGWCATVQAFRTEAEIEAWCARHRQPRGEAVPWSQVLELGRAWYGSHREPTWRKWTTSQAAAIFSSVGLRSPFWQLPESDAAF
jgi:Alkylmercury lyase